jgi:hypothetical protein
MTNSWWDAPAETRWVAHHEAGHAIVAAVLGVKVREVTVVPADGNLGHCQLDYDATAKDDDRVVISLAGPATEDVFYRRRPNTSWFRRDRHPRNTTRRDDWRRAWWRAQTHLDRLASDGRPDDPAVVDGDADPRAISAFLRWTFERAKLLVSHDANFRAICVLARRLVAAKTLGDAAVRQALGAGRGLSRQETVRELRRLDVLDYPPHLYSLDRLLAALRDVRGGRPKKLVRKELCNQGFWAWQAAQERENSARQN